MRPLRILLAFFCLIPIVIFEWGYFGYVISGSSGAPSSERTIALFAGGFSYLILLFAIAFIFVRSDDWRAKAFGEKVADGTRMTVIYLLWCIPLSFMLIGMALPMIILPGSWVALVIAACATDDES